MKNCLFYILLLGLITGCQEYVTQEYKNDPMLYFANETYGQRDSISQTFFVLPDEQMTDTVWVDIRTMGFPTNYDRPIALVQTNTEDANTAIAGTHYISFDEPWIKEHLTIPAGEVKAMIPIVWKKTQELLTKQVRMVLEFEKNEHFKPGISEWTKFVITSTAAPAKPSNWETRWKHTFGVWGPVKMKFIIDYVGFSDFSSTIDLGYTNYLKTKAAQKLFEYNQAHPDEPLQEADGTYVTF